MAATFRDEFARGGLRIHRRWRAAIGQAAATPWLLSIGTSRGLHETLNVLTDLLALGGFTGLWIARACGDGLAARIGLGLSTFGAGATFVAQTFEALGQPISNTLFEFVVTPTSTIGFGSRR